MGLIRLWLEKRKAKKSALLKWRKTYARFIELIEDAPEIMDSLLQLAEVTAQRAVLDKLYESMNTKDLDAAFFKKLAESASAGILINVKMNNADVTFRKEDVYDDMARHRFSQLLREQSPGVQTAFKTPEELTR